MINVPLPLMIQSLFMENNGVKIYYPQVIGHWDTRAQQKMNEKIKEVIEELIKEQYEEQGMTDFTEMISTFEIKTNERNVLSIAFNNYAYASGSAHGLTLMKSLTFDVNNGKNYKLHELFQSDSQFIKRISNIIKNQIEERDIPVIDTFTTISKNQDYYIADKSIVIYFPVYALTPGYYGFPMFPISVYDLQDIVVEDGPLGRMLED